MSAMPASLSAAHGRFLYGRAMSDEIGHADAADDEWVPEQRELSWGHPSTLAVMSFALAVLVLLGAQLFRGVLYAAPFLPSQDGSGGSGGTTTVIVAGSFLSAAFALLPLLLAVRGLRLLVPDDPGWAGPLLRAAAALAGIALALRLVLAILATTADDNNNGLFGYLSLL
jgi:hypothetical protein